MTNVMLSFPKTHNFMHYALSDTPWPIFLQKYSSNTALWWTKDERADKTKAGPGMQKQKNQTLIVLSSRML